MESPAHTINALFDQLGLDSSDEDIEAFIDDCHTIPDNLALYDAGFWTPSQAAFLKQAVEEDADWAEVVDNLNAMLRE